MINLVRSVFESVLKTNDSLEFGVLTDANMNVKFDYIWSFLLHTGYLKLTDISQHWNTNKCYLES